MSSTNPLGFTGSGLACGIKGGGTLDLALVATADGRPVPAAAVVTANRAKAAPVLITLAHLAATDGRAAAVVINSGNANAATGDTGRRAARLTCEAVAAELGCRPEEVLVCSTGLIGIPLPVDRLLPAVPQLVSSRSRQGLNDAARAILTTDTRTKQCSHAGSGWAVAGMAKGAAMLSPRLAAPHATTGGGPAPHATMLSVLTTDVEIDHTTLTAALTHAVERSFNRLEVDGATSTNDTVIVLASGLAGPPDSVEEFVSALSAVCADLAMLMAIDAEGATKTVRVTVNGAAGESDAVVAARAVARSQLVQCSLYGADPYWGRVVSELGSSGAAFDIERVSVSYGGIEVCRNGVGVAHDTEGVSAHMQGRLIQIRADLGLGEGEATITTTDLSPGYIAENMRTS